jgi:hypothetical protein
MARRSGATLMEVLIAVFVTAVGLLALLALFPVGAFNMAQALRYSRAAQAAGNADSVAAVWNLRQDQTVLNAMLTPTAPSDQPTNSYPSLTTAATGYVPDPSGRSYPVYVDSTGFGISSSPYYVGEGILPGAAATPVQGIPRIAASFAQTTANIVRWMTLQDDLTFASNGTPAVPAVQREGRYSWCYLLQMPAWGEPNTVNMTVVVYSGRSSLVRAENTYYVDWQAGSTTVVIPYNPSASPPQEKPAVRPGRWVLDATVVNPQTPAGPIIPDPHGFFYRVVNVSDATYTSPATGATYPAVQAELQTPIRKSTTVAAGSRGQEGVLVVLDNVVEVFDREP